MKIQDIKPNKGHRAAAALEKAWLVSGVITQNTDSLHTRAGSKNIAELHGTGDVIRCIPNGHRWSRKEVLTWFDAANPGFGERNMHVDITPDGDAEVTEVEDVVVPVCPACGGMLRPDIVYFGEHVPLDVFSHAEEIVAQSNALIVAGTSLAVNTGVRIINRAEQRDIPIAVINRGATAVDHRPSIGLRIEGGTTEWLAAVADKLT